MKVYTYSEARQRLARLLEQARREGKVQIRRRDAMVQPVGEPGSPLDVPPVKAGLRRGELEELIQEGRGVADRFWRRPEPTTGTGGKKRQ